MYRTKFAFGPDSTTVVAWKEATTSCFHWNIIAMDARRRGPGWQTAMWTTEEAHPGIKRTYQSLSGAQGVGYVDGGDVIELGWYRTRRRGGGVYHGTPLAEGRAHIYVPVWRDGYKWEIDDDYPTILVYRPVIGEKVNYRVISVLGISQALDWIENFKAEKYGKKAWNTIKIPYMAEFFGGGNSEAEEVTIRAMWMGHAGEGSKLPSLFPFCKDEHERAQRTLRGLSIIQMDDDGKLRTFRQWENSLGLYNWGTDSNYRHPQLPPERLGVYRKKENYISHVQAFNASAPCEIGEWNYDGDRFFWRRFSPTAFMCVIVTPEWDNEYEITLSIEDWFKGGLSEAKAECQQGLDNKIIQDAIYRAQDALTPEVLLTLMREHPLIEIKIDDSLAVGNCRPGTEAWMVQYGFPSWLHFITFEALAKHDSIDTMLDDFNFRKVVIRRAMLDHIIPSVYGETPAPEVPVSVEIVENPNHAAEDPSTDA